MKIRIFSIMLLALALASCDKYLDRLPDDRAELDSRDKIINLLVSAYPSASNNLVMEVMSDNVLDNGRQYGTSILMEEIYRFMDTVEEGTDSPRSLWNSYYESVAICNQVLAAIEDLGDTPDLAAPKAEAKMVRAYSMFMLASTFCMAWNPDKADEYLGLPYPLEPESDVNATHTRGTLRELYAAIDKDIEEALPNISDDYYRVPKYHFNVKAAYAFAARFNLFYMNYDKCIKYANMVLGANPLALMRNFEPYGSLGRADISNRYVQSSEACNLMLLATYSLAGRNLSGGSSARFHHNYNITAYETYWVSMPWGSGSSANTLYYSNMLYGSNQYVSFPKIDEFFEYSDKVNGIGYPHIVDPIFTGDETLLCRAEAYILKKDFENGLKDMNLWVTNHCRAENEGTVRPVLTVQNVNDFIENLDTAVVVPEGNRERSIRKAMVPQGFTIDQAPDNHVQSNILQFLLHMRRLETIYQGLRFMDLKRYGIAYSHPVSGEDAQVFEPGDLRGAIQLPNDVINAGLQANPRKDSNKSGAAGILDKSDESKPVETTLWEELSNKIYM